MSAMAFHEKPIVLLATLSDQAWCEFSDQDTTRILQVNEFAVG
jgi:hypothetical protein